jgi:spore coat polysaccharide biosynthesis protein SpsF
MTTAAIVQTRMGSRRLPGKVLMTIEDRTVLAHVLGRCMATTGIDAVCCATTDQVEDDPVVAEAEKLGATVFRGSELDVLGRYYGAAREVGADVILRVTCDCPMIDPEVNAAVLRRRSEANADFATNNLPPSWPHGLDCEAITIDALGKANMAATSATDRGEFVTPWLRRNTEISKANVRGPGGPTAEMRWTLDYPEDFEFFNRLFEKTTMPAAEAGWRDFVEVIDRFPNLNDLNFNRRIAKRIVAEEAEPES